MLFRSPSHDFLANFHDVLIDRIGHYYRNGGRCIFPVRRSFVVDSRLAGFGLKPRQVYLRTLNGAYWPFSEVRERLLNMLVVERVRFAFYRRSLRSG